MVDSNIAVQVVVPHEHAAGVIKDHQDDRQAFEFVEDRQTAGDRGGEFNLQFGHACSVLRARRPLAGPLIISSRAPRRNRGDGGGFPTRLGGVIQNPECIQTRVAALGFVCEQNLKGDMGAVAGFVHDARK